MEAKRRESGTAVPKGIFRTPERLPDQVSPRQPSSQSSPRQERAGFQMTEESIAEYLRREEEQGASPHALRKRRGFVTSLYAWLPEDRVITEDILRSWREEMEEKGYAQETILNYVKGINRYLRFANRPDLCFSRGKPKDIAGRQFGYLTAVSPTGAKNRKDLVWECRCRCGNTVELPATRLLTGNTLSCGCLKGEHLHDVNKFMDGTSIRQSMKEQVESARSSSGFTGVTAKQDKWKAYIGYKRKNYYLGSYSDLNEAVRARARAKQMVQENARGLLETYEEMHRNDPARPNRKNYKETEVQEKEERTISEEKHPVRSNNTSGCTGVSRKRDRWTAKITWQKTTFQLGVFKEKEEAVHARKTAEQLLKTDPQQFLARYI